jgi:hypothetical protein
MKDPIIISNHSEIVSDHTYHTCTLVLPHEGDDVTVLTMQDSQVKVTYVGTNNYSTTYPISTIRMVLRHYDAWQAELNK